MSNGFLDNMPLQKYMDFHRLVAAIANEGLWFSRIDCFKDPWEGIIPQRNLNEFISYMFPNFSEESIKEIFLRHESELRSILESHCISRSDFDSSHEIRLQVFLLFTKTYLYADCWFMGTEDSISMWDSFGSSFTSIKILSEVDLLNQEVENFSVALKDFIPVGGQVKTEKISYLDYAIDKWQTEFNPFLPAFHKRKEYEHEKEYRAVIQVDGRNFEKRGLYVPVDLSKVITGVVLNPKASDDLKESVEFILKTAKIDVPVVKSTILKPPTYWNSKD
jgi:hypothetical protein